MTISASDRITGGLVCDGETTSFDFNFPITSKSDLNVYLTDKEDDFQELVLDSDYTISGSSWREGGTIETSEAYETGFFIVIESETEINQQVSLRNAGEFNPAILERALDKLTKVSQELLEKVSRSLKSRVDVPLDYVITELVSGNLIKMVDGELVSSIWNDESIQSAIDFAISNYYTKSESDSIFLNSSGDTATGNIKSPDAVGPTDLTTLKQVAAAIDARIASTQPAELSVYDMGLVTGILDNTFDMGAL